MSDKEQLELWKNKCRDLRDRNEALRKEVISAEKGLEQMSMFIDANMLEIIEKYGEDGAITIPVPNVKRLTEYKIVGLADRQNNEYHYMIYKAEPQ